MNLHLVRTAYLKTCTLGTLYVGAAALATLERPWIPHPDGPGGMRRTSCVPDGDYRLTPHSSERFPGVWALINPALGVWYQPGDIPAGQTWGRSAVLIHAGNRVADVVGCIAVGLTHGRQSDEPAVMSSLIALRELRSIAGPGEHRLCIRTTPGATGQRQPP